MSTNVSTISDDGNNEDNGTSLEQQSTEFQGNAGSASSAILAYDNSSKGPVGLNSKSFLSSVDRKKNKCNGTKVSTGENNIWKTITETEEMLIGLEQKVYEYFGSKSDKRFLHLKYQLHTVHKNVSHLTQKNNGFMSNFKKLLNRTEDIWKKLNDRANYFEEANDNHVIRQIKEQMAVIHNDIENNRKTIDELNLCDNILKGFILSLDNINTKDRPAVKGNYEEAVRQVYETLNLLNEKAKSLTKTVDFKHGSSMESPDNALDNKTLVASKQNDNEVTKQQPIVFTNSTSHSHNVWDNKKEIIYNSNQAVEIEKLIFHTLDNDSLDTKLNGDNDAINCSALSKKHNMREHELDELERYGKCLNESQTYYKKELNDKILLLDYSPEPEKIDQFHAAIFPNTLKVLKNKCSNLNINLDSKIMIQQLKELIAQDLKIIKENVASRRFLVRNIHMSTSDQCAYAIGIDFGTTFSCVTEFKNNKFEVLKNFQELRKIPSVVYIGSDKPSVGYEALKKGMDDPFNLIQGVKRIMGRSYNEPEVQSFISSSLCKIKQNDEGGVIVCSSKNKYFTPEHITAEILKEMKLIAENHLKHPVKNVVVTIPASFSEPQRRAYLDACKIAELNVLRLLNEPTAAALASVYHFKNKESKNVLVFDLGGGTCDISILEINGNNLSVKASFGNNYLGGLDFDQNVADQLQTYLKTKMHISINNQIVRMTILKECEKVKKLLSENKTAKISLTQIHDGLDSEIQITRSTFENWNKKLFVEILATVKKCLENAGLRKYQIDEIVLNGSSSHIPKIQQMLNEYFKDDKVRNKINPEEATSYGAALQAAILTGEYKNDFKISDIIPHSLGVTLRNDVYEIIIQKNTNIPCKGTKCFSVNGNQARTFFKILQGENPVASQNTCFGSLTKFHTPRKAGRTELYITFEIDENGILSITY